MASKNVVAKKVEQEMELVSEGPAYNILGEIKASPSGAFDINDFKNGLGATIAKIRKFTAKLKSLKKNEIENSLKIIGPLTQEEVDTDNLLGKLREFDILLSPSEYYEGSDTKETVDIAIQQLTSLYEAVAKLGNMDFNQKALTEKQKATSLMDEADIYRNQIVSNLEKLDNEFFVSLKHWLINFDRISYVEKPKDSFAVRIWKKLNPLS